MCILDGSFYKTDKSALLKSVEKHVQTKAPTFTNKCLIEGFSLIHSISEWLNAFGSLCKMLINDRAYEIQSIFDIYWSISIKGYERTQKGGSTGNRMYVISGPEQIRHADFGL